MKKQRTKQPNLEVEPKQNGFQDLIVSIACISCLPAIYVIWKAVVSWLG